MKTIRLIALVLIVLSLALAFASCGGTVKNITLSFVVDGSVYDEIETTGATSISMPENPSKEGYTFDGWFWDDGTWSQSFTANSLLDAPLSSSMSVYAKMTPIAYTVTYETDGGTHRNPGSYTIEDAVSLTDAAKAGYDFDGWYNGEVGVTAIQTGSKGDLTLSARWTPITYQVSYANTKNAENGNPDSYTIETATIALADLSAVGYTFDGWYDGNKKVTEIATGSIGDRVLSARWTPVSYNSTYSATFGATNGNPMSDTIEGAV
ncbi:MAG: InlB B-repeat-containing protein [Clostridia bacterium]|nr:InlB B-repeat-containing protein [Clostridia bacterium]